MEKIKRLSDFIKSEIDEGKGEIHLNSLRAPLLLQWVKSHEENNLLFEKSLSQLHGLMAKSLGVETEELL